MQSLQIFLNTLIEIIIQYHDSQFPNKKFSKEKLFQKSQEESEKILSEVIKNIIHIYKERENFLKYTAYIINTLQPLINKNTLLTDFEAKRCYELIHAFLLNCKTLFTIKKNNHLTVKYDEYNQKMSGFLLGGNYLMNSSICNTGQLLNKNLLISDKERSTLQGYSISLIEQNIQYKIQYAPEEVIEKFVKNLITSYQKPYIQIEKNKILENQCNSLRKDIFFLREQFEKSSQEIGALKISEIRLQEESNLLKEQVLKMQEDMKKLNQVLEEAQITIQKMQKNNTKYFANTKRTHSLFRDITPFLSESDVSIKDMDNNK